MQSIEIIIIISTIVLATTAIVVEILDEKRKMNSKYKQDFEEYYVFYKNILNANSK
jgi:protein-S-isoprenylcysteine O-methyltransferase Ste14